MKHSGLLGLVRLLTTSNYKAMLSIRIGDRILFRNEYGGSSEGFVLHKFWLFGIRLKVMTYKSQEYVTISSNMVIDIIERDAIGKY